MAVDQIVGAIGSPYSRKLRAVFRYRRIPHVWIHMGSPEAEGLPKPRVSLLPQLIVTDETGRRVALVDSTPLLRELERRHPNGRSIVPSDPALAFLDALIEDFADEWLTKAMFHYRWSYAPDIAKASAILPRWAGSRQSDATLEKAGSRFAARQIGRLAVVGSNPTTGPVIERSFLRLLAILERHFEAFRFLLGDRPGASDFGLYGQLTQLALFDPTPSALVLARAPRVAAWTELVEDLSGLEPDKGSAPAPIEASTDTRGARTTDMTAGSATPGVAVDGWLARDALPETVASLLGELGRCYAPFLLANAEALVAGRDEVVCTIDGSTWRQAPFPYQGKCLEWLRVDYRALCASDREAVDRTLSGTGCEALFA